MIHVTVFVQLMVLLLSRRHWRKEKGLTGCTAIYADVVVDPPLDYYRLQSSLHTDTQHAKNGIVIVAAHADEHLRIKHRSSHNRSMPLQAASAA